MIKKQIEKTIKESATRTTHRRQVGPKTSNNGNNTRRNPVWSNPCKTLVALRYQEILLRHADVQLLQGAHELNERLISFCYAYLQSKRYKMHQELHFLMPAIANGLRYLEGRKQRNLVHDLKLDSKQFIFVPLYEDLHWSLMLVARPDRRIYYFDSQDYRHVKLAHLLDKKLRVPLNAENYVFTIGRCLQQAVGHEHESGVHLMCMTDTMADYVWRCGYATSTLLVAKEDVRGKRKNQLQLIRTLGGSLPNSQSSSSCKSSNSPSLPGSSCSINKNL